MKNKIEGKGREVLTLKMDEKTMINEKGYALITMAFILVSFFSVILVASYPIVKEAREETASYIIDRNDYRFRKAFFGEAVDQCGTKLAHQGGHYSDYDRGGQFGTKGYYYQTRVIGRLLGTLGYPNEVETPKDYEYTADTFWAGYWGKRYIHLLPCDKWDYVTLYPDLGKEKYDLYAPFWQPYASVFMSSVCQGTAGYKNFAKGRLQNYSNFSYTPRGNVHVEVKDYSEKRTRHELRLITIGSNNYCSTKSFQNIFFERGDGPTYFADYALYKFKQSKSGLSSLIAANSGQKKLMIQVRENPDSLWITMETKLITFPHNVGFKTRILTYEVNFYG